MLDSTKNKSLIHWFWSNCSFYCSICILIIVYTVFVHFKLKNFYSLLLFIFALNWVWGNCLYQLSFIIYVRKWWKWFFVLMVFIITLLCFVRYFASFYEEMLSDEHIFKSIIFFVVNYYILTLHPMKTWVLSVENNWKRKLIIVFTYLLIMLIPIFLFGVYDYCIYHSDLIETLNGKGAIHELYDIINQGIKVVSSEHENEKIIFMVLWFCGTLFLQQSLSGHQYRRKMVGIADNRKKP